MAPSTPPPPSKLVLAAFTMASTFCFVMSPSTTAIRANRVLLVIKNLTSHSELSKALWLHHTKFGSEFGLRISNFCIGVVAPCTRINIAYFESLLQSNSVGRRDG